MGRGDVMNWMLLVLGVAVVFIFLRFREVRHRTSHLVIILLIVILVGSLAHVYLSNDLDLGSFDGIAHAGQVYFSWLGTAISNIGKVSTYAVHQDWGVSSPEDKNETGTS